MGPESAPPVAPLAQPVTTTRRVISYTYDSLYRLTDAEYSTGEYYQYAYDAVGNRLSLTTHADMVNYQYDAANRLLVSSSPGHSVSYTWDDNGNLLSDGVRTYSYDHANRMVQVVSGTLTTQFAYNGAGDRVAKTVDGVTTDYVLDPAAGLTQVLQETTGGQTQSYLYGHDLLAQYDSGTWAYHVNDGLGSVRQLADPLGQVVQSYSFSPFGVPLGESGGGYGEIWYPERPTYLLRVSRATLHGTPVPLDTPMPSGSGLAPNAGQEIGLAFHLREVATGTQGSGAGVPHTPRVEARYTDRPVGEGHAANNRVELPVPPLSAFAILAAPTLAMVWVRSRGHRTPRWAWVVLALTMGAGLGCGIGYNVPVNPYPSENRVDDILGEVEPVVLAERGPGLSSKVSPNGRWLIVNLENVQGNMDQLIAIDLEHNREYQIAEGLWARGLVWLDDNHAVIDVASGPVVFRASDRTVWSLENQMPRPDSLGGLGGADFIYAIEELRGGGSCLVTTDPDFPYLVAVNWEGAELEENLSGIPHTIIQTGLVFDPDARYYSPDGRYYIAERSFRDPGSFMTHGQEAMFDAATEKEVAHAYKHYWATYFLGWAYDSSGAYFMFQPRGADADILHPRHPIYKLLVPGATPRGTPVPMYTPTPTRDSSVPPGATVIPLNTPIPPDSSRAPGAGSLADGGRTAANGVVRMAVLTLPLLAASALVVVGQWCQNRTRRRWVWVVLAGLTVACGPCTCGPCIGYNVPANPYPGENRLQDVLGEVEPVVLAEREPMLASVSPDGKWMLVLLQDSGPVLAIDLEHNQEYEVLPDKGSHGQWLNESYAVVGRMMLHVPSLETWRLESRYPDPDSLDVLEGADHVYALENLTGGGERFSDHRSHFSVLGICRLGGC